jgi:hypothetical protein
MQSELTHYESQRARLATANPGGEIRGQVTK